jgi:hypothetical protein
MGRIQGIPHLGAKVKFIVATIMLAFGYALFYDGLYYVWKYNPSSPSETHVPPLSVLLGRKPNLTANANMYSTPPFSWS